MKEKGDIWFKKKEKNEGYGVKAVTREGYVMLLAYFTAIFWILWSNHENLMAGKDTNEVMGTLLFLTIIGLFVVYKKTEKPK